MFSPINIHKKEDFSNDFLTINNTIPNLHYSKSRITKAPNNPQNNNKLLRLIQINPYKSSDRGNRSPINTKNNISEISNVKYIPRRLANIPGLSMEIPLKLIGRSNLDCKRLFGENLNTNNKKENKEEKENNYNKNSMNIKDNSFKNEYIYKFSVIANNFNKLVKYSEFISNENQNIFNEIFKKIKELLKKQPHLFFDNNTLNTENVKNHQNDLKSGFFKYRSDNIYSLPKIINPSYTKDEVDNNISKTELHNVSIEQDNINKQKIASQWYEIGSLMNKLLTVILGELRDYKYSNKKLNQKITEYEIKLANNNKEIENMKKFLNKYEVSSKIYLKIKTEKELDKVKASFNQKENQYILSIYKLEEEIKTLTTLLEHNQKYYHE